MSINTSEDVLEGLALVKDNIARLFNEIEHISLDIPELVDQKVHGQLKDISQQLADLQNISDLRARLEEQYKQTKSMHMKLFLELAKVKEVIIALAEYIDPKKKINFRKNEKEKKPRLYSKALRNIVNNIEEKE